MGAVIHQTLYFLSNLQCFLARNILVYHYTCMNGPNSYITGGPRVLKIPSGDNMERLTCPECDFIHYENPHIVAGAVVTYNAQFLLCKRAIEPRTGFWTIPAGYMELNETPEQGAVREAAEEACAKISINSLLALYTLPRLSQVQMIYRATISDPIFAAGVESLEVALFDWKDIPWDDLAFPTVHWALKHFKQVEGLDVYQPFGNRTPDFAP